MKPSDLSTHSPMQRDSVNYNDLIAELRNTWMEKAHNPESRLCSPCAGSVTVGCGPISLSPLRISTAAHFKCVCSGLYDFMTRGHFSHVGWEEEYLPLVPGMLTELSLHCMGAECGQIFGTGTGLGLPHLSCWSPTQSCSQNRSPNSFLYKKQISQVSVFWALVISECVQLGGIERYVWVCLFLLPHFSVTQMLVLCCFNRTTQLKSSIK